MMSKPNSRQRSAGGLTLIELLVTLGIISLLAALILPTVRSLLVGRKASQAGLLVRNYLEAARARAIATEREVAVVLERVSSRVYDENGNGIIDTAEIRSAVASNTDLASNYTVYNSCIRLSLAEEQRPSDAQSFGIERLVRALPLPELPSIEDGGELGNYNVVILRGNATTTPVIRALFSTRPYNDTNVLQVPLQISFDSVKYPIVKVFDDGEVEPGISRFRLLIPRSRSIESNELVNPPNDLPSLKLYPFNIHFRPRYLATQSLSMPRGTCVDLSLSGFGADKRVDVMNAAGVPTSRTTGDYRMRFSSDWSSLITSAAPGSLRPLPLPEELRPIILVFGPRGNLTRVYANYDMPTTTGRPVDAFKPIDVVDDVYLHIGKIDQVSVRFESSDFPYAGNLADLNSQIIRISASDGSVTVAPTGAIRIPEDTLPTVDSSGGPVPPEVDPSWVGAPLSRVSQIGVLVDLARRRAIGASQTAQ